jgi:hypothetical protein
MKMGCVFIIKGNSRTKKSYLHLSIPLRHITNGINKMTAGTKDLKITVEVLPDDEFDWRKDKINRDFDIEFEEKHISCLFIPEEKVGSIVDICLRGFMEIYRASFDIVPEDLEVRIRKAVEDDFASIPVMEPPEEIEEIEYREKGSGVVTSFFSSVVKCDSLKRSYPGGIKKFVADSESYWDCDHDLLCTIAMDGSDLNDLVAALKKHGLQGSTAPVDFYVLDAGLAGDFFGDGRFVPPLFLTHDDGQLDFYVDDDEKIRAILKQTDLL